MWKSSYDIQFLHRNIGRIFNGCIICTVGVGSPSALHVIVKFSPKVVTYDDPLVMLIIGGSVEIKKILYIVSVVFEVLSSNTDHLYQTTQGWFNGCLEVWKTRMAVFGLVKDLASRQSGVNGCVISYSWLNAFCVVFVAYQPLKEPLWSFNLISRL